jgi:3-isopropylmalate/(R)-2-methylmalate dehydratase small subunit
MQPFLTLTGIAAPLPIANVDTDMILPARFLKTISRTGLGEGLLHALRFAPGGGENPDFILNRDPWRGASILVALDNFGCGSSREHAPWALLDYGIRCIVAPDFADIFFGNCLKNGILPVKLEGCKAQQLMDIVSRPEDAEITIDLERRLVLTRYGQIAFRIDAAHRERLMTGADEIGLSLRHADAIADHERRNMANAATVHRIAAALGA